jgi:MOSC domain-containing protein YiiM
MNLPVGTRLKVGEVELEITQIGKACHKGCAIRDLVGDCVMPREGVFARVLRGGVVVPGDTVEVLGFPG